MLVPGMGGVSGKVVQAFGTLGWKSHRVYPMGAWKIRILRVMQAMEDYIVKFQREAKTIRVICMISFELKICGSGQPGMLKDQLQLTKDQTT